LDGYCGLKHENIDDDGDNVVYREVDKGDRESFFNSGIEVILLEV
jgi:hypothetical protein